MKNTGRFILYLLILVVVATSLQKYVFSAQGLPPNFEGRPIGLYTHIFGAIVTLLLGPLQFSARLRQRHRQVHRWLGRMYLGIGVLVGGLAGLYMSLTSHGGPAVRVGFMLLALIWLYTGFKAYQSIRAGEVELHRAYMVRNFSLTLAAVTLRIYLPLLMMSGVQFETTYTLVAWLSWVPNLLLAEMLLNRGRALPIKASST
jgi:uncharacterized membrane protein